MSYVVRISNTNIFSIKSIQFLRLDSALLKLDNLVSSRDLAIGHFSLKFFVVGAGILKIKLQSIA